MFYPGSNQQTTSYTVGRPKILFKGSLTGDSGCDQFLIYILTIFCRKFFYNNLKEYGKKKKKNETIPPTITESVAATKNGQTSNNAAAPLPIPASVTFAKPFPDISKIEVFDGNNFIRWM
ncbi:hypothetical protein COLO4_28802 [Corchorus olitorius]|uniref:Uncharacterized protein n=1 Tax=Corchorus olitorius TaxID=93759 RepID=A0A1R3HI71_9ROSI|nr:hypothetical protein COLO4_28802 [Corchorus olitorius]